MQKTVKEKQTVVLVHGQGRTRFSMVILEKRFASAGFRTANFPYNQAIHSLNEISSQLIEFIETKVETESYHLIGCLLYTSPSPRDATLSRMPSSA